MREKRPCGRSSHVSRRGTITWSALEPIEHGRDPLGRVSGELILLLLLLLLERALGGHVRILGGDGVFSPRWVKFGSDFIEILENDARELLLQLMGNWQLFERDHRGHVGDLRIMDIVLSG